MDTERFNTTILALMTGCLWHGFATTGFYTFAVAASFMTLLLINRISKA